MYVCVCVCVCVCGGGGGDVGGVNRNKTQNYYNWISLEP